MTLLSLNHKLIVLVYLTTINLAIAVLVVVCNIVPQHYDIQDYHIRPYHAMFSFCSNLVHAGVGSAHHHTMIIDRELSLFRGCFSPLFLLF